MKPTILVLSLTGFAPKIVVSKGGETSARNPFEKVSQVISFKAGDGARIRTSEYVINTL